MVLSCFLIHNFIGVNQNEADIFGNFEQLVGIDGQAHYVDIEELEEGGLKNIASKAWRLGIADDMWPDWPVAHRL